jgi:hypothetical protein
MNNINPTNFWVSTYNRDGPDNQCINTPRSADIFQWNSLPNRQVLTNDPQRLNTMQYTWFTKTGQSLRSSNE